MNRDLETYSRSQPVFVEHVGDLFDVGLLSSSDLKMAVKPIFNSRLVSDFRSLSLLLLTFRLGLGRLESRLVKLDLSQKQLDV